MQFKQYGDGLYRDKAFQTLITRYPLTLILSRVGERRLKRYINITDKVLIPNRNQSFYLFVHAHRDAINFGQAGNILERAVFLPVFDNTAG